MVVNMKVIVFNHDDKFTFLVPTVSALKTMTVDEIAKKDVPEGVSYKIVEDTELAEFNDFISSVELVDSELTVNMDKAKAACHNVRRSKRDSEFAPLDEQISKQIPGVSLSGVESQRQAIRDKYDQMQVKIDVAVNTNDLKQVLKDYGMV